MTRRLDLAMLLLLTFSTGMVDAIGYLGFDKVFTGNMTGNVVILGMGLAGADGVPVLRPALALLIEIPPLICILIIINNNVFKYFV